jgi:hypothetical protein
MIIANPTMYGILILPVNIRVITTARKAPMIALIKNN